jgi:hypothetical protein
VSCGSDGEESTSDVVDGASTCQDLLDGIDFTEISAEEAVLVASRMYEIAADQVADDGVLDEQMPRGTIVRRIEDNDPDAVTDGYRQVSLDDQIRAALAEVWGTPG